MSFRLLGLTGQVLITQPANIGLTQHHIESGHLAAGIYFLQIMADNQMMGIFKLVRQ